MFFTGSVSVSAAGHGDVLHGASCGNNAGARGASTSVGELQPETFGGAFTYDRVTLIFSQGRTVYSSVFENVRSLLRPKHRSPLQKTFLIKKITKQDKETIDKRTKEVPESHKTICRETELVRGYEAQDRGGAQVFCSFADIVALMS